jgi:hypothetical protein
MFTRPVVIAFLALAGPILVFEAYGIHRLRQPLPPAAETALDTVCALLLRSAEAKGLTAVAKEIESVSGPERDPFFDSLAPFLNARLEPGFKRFLFSNDIRAKSVAEIGRLMKRRAWVGSPGDMSQAVPDVLLLAEWKYFPLDDVALTVRAVRLGVSGDGVQASVRFTHPRAVQREKKKRDQLRLALFGAATPLATLGFLSIGYWIHPRLAGGS